MFFEAYTAAMGQIARLLIGGSYRLVVKPVLFRMSPDDVHRAMIKSGARMAGRKIPLQVAQRLIAYDDTSCLAQELLGLTFSDPIGISAGLDKNADLLHAAEAIGCGFTTYGSVTMEPRKGNAHPWFYRLPKSHALVVHAGMPNIGIKAIGPKLARKQWTIPIIASVAVIARYPRDTIDDTVAYVKECLLYIEQHHLANIIEINISCPNVVGDQVFQRTGPLDQLLTMVDELSLTIPISIKMPSLKDWQQFKNILTVIKAHRIQAVTIANLIKDRENVQLADTLPSSVKGGVSGLPARERSLELIRKTYQYCGDSVLIIGVGGTFGAQDAYEKICAGASLVGMITGLIYEGPQVVGGINRGLVELLKRDGYTSIQQAIGSKASIG